MSSIIYSHVYSAIREMGRVIYALILREIKSRYGNQRLGYIWAFLEPLLFVGLFYMLYSLRGMFTPPNNMGLELFLITGIVPFFAFRHVMSGSIRALKGNKQLLTYPQVQSNDISIANFLLENATNLIVFFMLVSGVHLLNMDNVSLESPLKVFAGFELMLLYGFGIGLFLSALFPIFPSVQPLSEAFLGRPLFFTSGIFFTAEMIPEAGRDILLFNPLFHTIEFIRSAFFKGYESSHYDINFMLSSLVLLVFFGLLMQRALHRYNLSLE